MTEQLGEKLTELNDGDSVILSIEGNQYKGDVTNTKRWMCELVGGIMESGDILIYLALRAETIKRHSPLTEHLLITATEAVPQAWEDPQASFYDSIEGETVAHIGTVAGVEIVNGSSDSV